MCRQHIAVLLCARLVCRLVCCALWGRLCSSRLLVLGVMWSLALTAGPGLPLLLDSGCLSLLGDCQGNLLWLIVIRCRVAATEPHAPGALLENAGTV